MAKFRLYVSTSACRSDRSTVFWIEDKDLDGLSAKGREELVDETAEHYVRGLIETRVEEIPEEERKP